MTYAHFKENKEGLLGYFLPTNALSKKKIYMCQYTKKPCALTMNRLVACLTDLNIYLPLFPGFNNSNNM